MDEKDHRAADLKPAFREGMIQTRCQKRHMRDFHRNWYLGIILQILLPTMRIDPKVPVQCGFQQSLLTETALFPVIALWTACTRLKTGVVTNA